MPVIQNNDYAHVQTKSIAESKDRSNFKLNQVVDKIPVLNANGEQTPSTMSAGLKNFIKLNNNSYSQFAETPFHQSSNSKSSNLAF